MNNLDSTLKSRDITLPTNVCLLDATIFPVVMHGCESWTVKKAECWRNDAFELWCWKRLLFFFLFLKYRFIYFNWRLITLQYCTGFVNCGVGEDSWVPWAARRSNKSIQTPILWPPDAKSWLIWKDLNAGKDWGREEKGTTEDEMVGWHHRLNGHEFG